MNKLGKFLKLIHLIMKEEMTTKNKKPDLS